MFDKVEQIPKYCHSGGAVGSDTVWEQEGQKYGIKTLAYSYNTTYHKSPNKVEISEEDYLEGIEEILSVKSMLNRNINRSFKYMNLLARNWPQVKYSDSTWAIGHLEGLSVAGGTGWAMAMSIKHGHPTHIFEQNEEVWYEWSYAINAWVPIKKLKIITENFAGIGTRNINEAGINAIKDVLRRSN